ncbi:MAG: UDP-2,3-diacylglucosamine hydrolase [Sulfuricurvum sp.]|nr:UDP-2,3-diacylglucosamine hydrolase [Sulfuricurvum sp.]
MSHNPLYSGAILIADAHCAPWRTGFIDFLHSIEAGTIKTPQLILMGDVLDMLYGPIPATHRYNRQSIELLNRLSAKIEIFYLEGNHDFLLDALFPNIQVVPRGAQPLKLSFEGKTVALAHGDTLMGLGYEMYTALIRNKMILAFLRGIDTIGGGFIVRWLERMMKRKNHCHPIAAFRELIDGRIASMRLEGCDVLIEGHFHQNQSFDIDGLTYINLGAFACNERYFTVQSNPKQPLLHEAVFRKEPL